MAYDCCGGKRRHLAGCPFSGSGPNPEKPKKKKRYCNDTWTTKNKGHNQHTCIEEEGHSAFHRCYCGRTA